MVTETCDNNMLTQYITNIIHFKIGNKNILLFGNIILYNLTMDNKWPIVESVKKYLIIEKCLQQFI